MLHSRRLFTLLLLILLFPMQAQDTPPPPTPIVDATAYNTPTPSSTLAATPTLSASGLTLINPTLCNQDLAPRLTIGAIARVTLGEPNNLRLVPRRSGALMGQIRGGEPLIVLDGPVCNDGLTWWRVRDNQREGWTAEGNDGIYWLEPALVYFPVITSPPATLRVLGSFTLGQPITALTATVESIYVGTSTQVEQFWINDPFTVTDEVTWLLGHRFGPLSLSPEIIYPTGFAEMLINLQPFNAIHLQQADLEGVSSLQVLRDYMQVWDANRTRTHLLAAERGDARVTRLVDLDPANYGVSLMSYQADGPVIDAKFGGNGEFIGILTATDLIIYGDQGTDRLFQVALSTPAAELVLRPDMRQALVLAADSTRLDLIPLDGGTALTLQDPDGIALPIYSPDGTLVLYAGGREVKLFDAHNGIQQSGLGRVAQFLDMSDNGQLIVLGMDSTVEIWGVWR